MTDQITRAAEILEGYAEFIKAEQADNLERHPYIPDIDEAARILRAAVAVDVQGLMALHDAAVAAAISVALERKGDRHGPTQDALESALRLALAARQGFVLEEPPLTGRWHHGAGNLVSGGVRIAQWDCDNNPPAEFRDKMLNWMCATLNAAVDAWDKTAPDEFAAAAPKGTP